MLLEIKPRTEYRGGLRSIFIKRISSYVTVRKDGEVFAEFNPDTILTGVTLVFQKENGIYPMGKYSVNGNCEGWVELAEGEDLFDSNKHFPAFVGDSSNERSSD